MNNRNQKSDFLPELRLGKIGELKIHQISDEELTRLCQGSEQSLFLNLGIGVLSTAASFLVALLTTTITSIKVFNVFVIVIVIGSLSGLVFMILWWRFRKSNRKLVNEIRNRMPPRGEAQELDPSSSESADCSPEAQQ